MSAMTTSSEGCSFFADLGAFLSVVIIFCESVKLRNYLLKHRISLCVLVCELLQFLQVNFYREWGSSGLGRVGNVQAPEFQTNNLKKNNFPVAVKISTSGYQTLQCLLQHSQLRFKS